jgi:hypothetical protein
MVRRQINTTMKKWPYWIKGGLLVAIIGTSLFSLLPAEASNLSYAPWYSGWFIGMPFVIFAPICILLNVDFISNAASQNDLFWAEVIWLVSIFVSLFIVGAIVSIIIKLLLNLKRNTALKLSTHEVFYS